MCKHGCCSREEPMVDVDEEERLTARKEPTYRKSTVRELRNSIESDSTYSSYSEPILPYDEDLVVINNKHVGCCYCFNYFIWVVFGGFWMSLFWCLAGILCCITVFGIPFGCKCFKIACIVLVPWKNKNAGVVKKHIYWIKNPTPAYFQIFCWYFCALWLSVMHLIFALLNAVILVGLPFAYQHCKWFCMCWTCGHIALTIDECEEITGIDARMGSDDEEKRG
ncbi:unnamed protein product [Amoebophrya sp. A25]|nr:unnamed protein product [Amoebophrya sp. A25]|eukprot:GSA25T00012683001.1